MRSSHVVAGTRDHWNSYIRSAAAALMKYTAVYFIKNATEGLDALGILRLTRPFHPRVGLLNEDAFLDIAR